MAGDTVTLVAALPEKALAGSEVYIYRGTTSTTAAAATIVNVTDSSGIQANDQIGLALDNSTMHWTTVASVGAGTITINAAIPASRSVAQYEPVYINRWKSAANLV
jgi:hypothetical protein